jgi:sulfate adenylyltransferase
MLFHEINENILQDIVALHTGLYAPLDGFMTSLDYHRVVDDMKLSDGTVWTLPITLDVGHDIFLKALDVERLYLRFKGKEVGFVEVSDCFKIDLKKNTKIIYKTNDPAHPGVAMELDRSEFRVAGKAIITNESVLKKALIPKKIRMLFSERGWKTIVGFQTRNPIHKAHEHLQRVGLDLCDGIFINPLVGWKRNGDFTEQSVMKAYECMIENYYPRDRVYLTGLKTYMRYAGPREAIFHAILRKNMGCTHFIIGRDHAGVGSFYGIYDAHELARKINQEQDLGIELMLLKEPFFCEKCDQIVSAKHCGHDEIHRIAVSGTKMRENLKNNKRPDARFMRPEITDTLLSMKDSMFIKE